MKKVWYNVYQECIKYSPSITAKVGEINLVAKVKSKGMAYQTCKAIQEMVGEYFKVYYK